MTTTKNDLPEKVRSEMIELLNARLADASRVTIDRGVALDLGKPDLDLSHEDRLA
jgi:hypothetical protein